MTEKSQSKDKQRDEALLRIKKKLDILDVWIKDGLPFKLLDGNKQVDAKGKFLLEYFPTSVRGLRLWNGDKNSKPVVKKFEIPTMQTSDKAWKAAPRATRIRVDSVEGRLSIFERLKEKALTQSSNKQKTKIQELEENLEFSEINSNGLANELIQLRLDNNFLESELNTAENRLVSAQQVMKQQLEFKTKNLQQANNKIKSLNVKMNRLKALLVNNGIEYSEIEKATSVIEFTGKKDND
jgi:hypothetical protein